MFKINFGIIVCALSVAIPTAHAKTCHIITSDNKNLSVSLLKDKGDYYLDLYSQNNILIFNKMIKRRDPKLNCLQSRYFLSLDIDRPDRKNTGHGVTELGSYAGTESFLYVVSSKDIKEAPLEKIDAQSPVVLSNSLKSKWIFSSNTTIQLVKSMPDFDSKKPDPGFKTIYFTYKWDGKIWNEKHVSKNQIWENDDAFPAAENFPD